MCACAGVDPEDEIRQFLKLGVSKTAIAQITGRLAGDRIDLTAFGFTRSELEQYVTIEEERFLIDTGEVVIRVEVGVELDLADFIE